MDCEKVHFVSPPRYQRVVSRRCLILPALASLCFGSGVGIALLAGCDTGASGITACRRIEQHRCNVAVGCPGISIETSADAAACEQLYRDQCLHGMAEGAVAGAGDVTACIAALDQARACEDASTTVAQCADPPALAPDVDTEATGCDLILVPERLADCDFLAPPEGEGGGDAAGGADGAGGGGGADGAGGADGGGGSSSGGASPG
jgi:uncharacterized membrane protein YgcG